MALFEQIGDADLSYTALGGGFLDLVNSALGTELTDADDFDALLSAALDATEEDISGLDELDELLGAAEFVDGEFDADTIAPLSDDLTEFMDSADGLEDEFD